MTKDLPSPELLRKLLRYEPETGKLFWRVRDRALRCSPKRLASWNAKYATKEAGSLDRHGYISIAIFRHAIPAHRIAIAMTKGEWPIGQIDHENGDRSDNRLANLRDVTPQENARNTKRRHDNKSGRTGVSFHVASGLWRAEISDGERRISLGYFNCVTGAAIARKKAEDKLGYHPNHGRHKPDCASIRMEEL